MWRNRHRTTRRATPIATTAAQGERNVFLSGNIASYAALLVSGASWAVSVRVGLDYFGKDLYGAWFIIHSIVGYFQMANFGIGLSSMNQLAHSADVMRRRATIRRSLVILAASALVVFVAVLVIRLTVPGWASVLGKAPQHVRIEASQALFVAASLCMAQLPTTLFAVAFSGLQRIHWTRIYSAGGAVAALAALYVTARVGGSLVMLAALTGLARLLVGLINGVHLFVSYPQLKPWLPVAEDSGPSYGVLLTNGLRFLALQIGAVIILNTGNVIIGHVLGAGHVSRYAPVFRLFYLGITLVNTIPIVLWPMYAKAIGAHNWTWVRRSYNVSITTVTILGSMLWVGGILFGQDIISWWMGPDMYGGVLLVVALGGYAYMAAFGGSNVSLLNALNPTTLQILVLSLDAVLTVSLSLLLVGPLGIAGVALGTFVSCAAVHFWFPGFYIRYRTGGAVSLNGRRIRRHLALVLLPSVAAATCLSVFVPAGWVRSALAGVAFAAYIWLSWRFLPRVIRLRAAALFR